jgi:hypothetical protein
LHDVLHKDLMTELCIVEVDLAGIEKGKHRNSCVQQITYKPFSFVFFL